MNKSLLALLLFFSSHSIFAQNIAGLNLPDSAQLAGQSLGLNGAGSRLMAGMFQVYVVALYLPESRHTPEEIFDEKMNKRLALHLLFNVSTRQLLDATHQLMEQNHSAAEMQGLASSWNAFSQLFDRQKDFNAGDQIMLDFETNKGCQVSVNGRIFGQISEQKFMRAFLKVWLGEHPAQANLKQQLLGVADKNVAH
jgi:hypothetical protein